jgi:hypothetical protein
MRKYFLKQDEVANEHGVIFLKEYTISDAEFQHDRRMSLFRCSCGKLFNTRLSEIASGRTISCGCYCSKRTRDVNTKHGMSRDHLYKAWTQLKERVFNSNDISYKNYGGRGITMFPPWQVDFQLFYDYISALPHFREKGYTLDRINNNGNYEPGNIRWATRNIQNRNMRKKKNNTSGYTGVSRFRNKWQVVAAGNHVGHFKTKEQGVIARNNYIIANNLIGCKIQEVK